MLHLGQIDESIPAIVLAEFAEGSLGHAEDFERLCRALVDVSHLNSALQVVDLLSSEPLHAQILRIWEDQDHFCRYS